MDWLQVLVIIFGNVAWVLPLWLWSRSESNADRREIREEMNADRREIINLINAIKDDMKDFHCRLALQDQEFKMRLCAIEERNNTK